MEKKDVQYQEVTDGVRKERKNHGEFGYGWTTEDGSLTEATLLPQAMKGGGTARMGRGGKVTATNEHTRQI